MFIAFWTTVARMLNGQYTSTDGGPLLASIDECFADAHRPFEVLLDEVLARCRRHNFVASEGQVLRVRSEKTDMVLLTPVVASGGMLRSA